MLVDKATQNVISIKDLPKILIINSAGDPLEWKNYEEYCKLVAKDKILYSLGKYEVILHGGINAVSGKQSILKIDTIVAVDNSVVPWKNAKTLSINKLNVYERDRWICAYCGIQCKFEQVSLDHVLPISKGGLHSWNNIVTACKSCNNAKGSMLLEDSNCPVQLLYIPYQPSMHEKFILKNRNILADQREFLMKKVPKNSRLHN